jgi:hypothetical protein
MTAVDEPTRFRREPGTDTCVIPRYARSGSEGGPQAPPKRAGVRFLAERWPTKGAGEWRDFWRERGMRELARVLNESWEPLTVASPAERESCAFRVASLLGSRAPLLALADELGRIRGDELGLPAAPDEDERAAATITTWFTSAAA